MISIRLAEKKDCEGMLEIYAPFIKETTTSFETEVPGTEIFWQRVSKVLSDTPWLVCEWDGKIVGYAYASQHRSRAAYDWSRELSVYVHPDFRKRNIATALYQTTIDILRLQGYCNVLAGITLPNPKSETFHQNFGFETIGIYKKVGYKFGAWRDTHWLQLFIGDPEQGAPELKPLNRIKGTEVFKSILELGVLQISNK